MDIAQLIADFGFPIVMVVGLGYFRLLCMANN